MLVPRVCAPRVTRFSLGKYWSRDFFQKEAGRMIASSRETGWLGIQTVILSRSDRLPRRWGQQAANPGVHRLTMTNSERQRNLMMHAQRPLPVYYSQRSLKLKNIFVFNSFACVSDKYNPIPFVNTNFI